MQGISKQQIEKSRTSPAMPTIREYAIACGLKESATWVAWFYSWSNDRECWTKIPLQYVLNDSKEYIRKAKSNDPVTWRDYESTLARVLWHHEQSNLKGRPPRIGIGIVCNSDRNGITMIDLDNCRNRDTGEIASWAKRIIELLDSYSEISPSGTGVKVFLLGRKPGERCRSKSHPNPDFHEVEIYNDGRFGAITGNHVPDAPSDVRPRQQQLNALYAEMFPDSESEHKSLEAHPESKSASPLANLSDQELITRAITSRNGDKFSALWNGDDSAYDNDASAADYALALRLAFWCGSDAARIESLMWKSGLVRDKWRKRRDYLTNTIARAIRAQSNHFGDARPSPFRDLYADEEFAFAKHIRPMIIKPTDRRAGPIDDAQPPAPSILPLILAGATIGGDRLATNRFADLCTPAAATVARQSEAEAAERREALRVADEIRTMRLRRFLCPALRRVLLQHRFKRYSRILHHRCDRWGCEGCGQLFRAQWIETARLRLNNHTWPNDSLFESRVFYRGEVPRSHWQKVYKRLTRLGANYYRIAPDGPDGFRDFVVITTHAAALRGYNPEPVDATAGLEIVSAILHTYHGDRRPISSSHPWAIPKREKTGPPQWTRIGKVDRNLSDRDIDEVAHCTGCELHERAPPDSARFRIIRVQDFAHAPDMQQSDVDYLHAVLMGQASIESWATRDVKVRMAGAPRFDSDEFGYTVADKYPQKGGWAVGRSVDLAAI